MQTSKLNSIFMPKLERKDLRDVRDLRDIKDIRDLKDKTVHFCPLCPLVMILFLLSFAPGFLTAENFNELKQKMASSMAQDQRLFNYPLNISFYQGRSTDEDVLVVLHGYGSDHTLAEVLQTYKDIPDHLISLDFPDRNLYELQISADKTTFGTIQELLPVIYLLNKLVNNAKVSKVNIYGFSAGGGALVNILAVLNSAKYDAILKKIGVSASNKVEILKAISRGWVLLDAPLKSMDEIDSRSSDSRFITQRYRKNDLRPIDSLKKLKGLTLNVIVYFETPDEALTNRDDDLYISLLKQNNPQGKNIAIKGTQGGHIGYHADLWRSYKNNK